MKPIPSRVGAALLGAAILLLPTGPARAGALASFEAGAVSGSGGHGGDWGYDPFLMDLVARICVEGVFYGGACSWFRTFPDAGDYMDLPVEPRAYGEALIPIVRVDSSYHWIESDVHAVEIAAELGYGPFAAQFTQTRFEEQEPDDTMILTRWHGLYRMSFGAGVEIDMGFGSLILDGNDQTGRFSFTLPILYHPLPGTGIEFRPAWSENVEEYDLALLAGWNFISLKAGYRWLRSPGRSLNGPYAGLSVHF